MTRLDELKALGVTYCPDSGVVMKHGIPAGCRRGNGYVGINVGGKQYYAHRIAWLFTHGRWPSEDIDHINRDKQDNRIVNLREATRSQNQRNHPLTAANKSGHKGVRWNKQARRWVAFMRINKKPKHLGSFTRLEDAVEARRRAETRHCGPFAYNEAA